MPIENEFVMRLSSICGQLLAVSVLEELHRELAEAVVYWSEFSPDVKGTVE